MSRRLIVTPKQIHAARAIAWARHYDNRAMAKAMIAGGWKAMSIIQELVSVFPEPALGIDGELLTLPLEARRKHDDILPFTLRGLLCKWYWSDNGWRDLERAFQSLPDPLESYYYKYDPEPNDRLLLVPVSSKPKQGSGGVPQKVQVPYYSAFRSV